MATLAFFKKGFLTYLQLTYSQTICLVSESQDLRPRTEITGMPGLLQGARA